MEPRDALNAVEVAIRELIGETLEAQFGPDWVEECGTPERIEGWRGRRDEERKRRDGAVTEDRLIYYSDFTDLRKIIVKHWGHFLDCFGDRKKFEVYMERLEEFRNPQMHSRSLLPFEVALLQGMAGEIRNQITIYRGGRAGSLDEHFPRIDHVPA